MNWNEKTRLKDSIRTRLAANMKQRGTITRDEAQETPNISVRQTDVIWRERKYTITEVDGKIVRLERAVFRIKVEYVKGTYMAVKDYGDDSGFLEEIGSGDSPKKAVNDLLRQLA